MDPESLDSSIAVDFAKKSELTVGRSNEIEESIPECINEGLPVGCGNEDEDEKECSSESETKNQNEESLIVNAELSVQNTASEKNEIAELKRGKNCVLHDPKKDVRSKSINLFTESSLQKCNEVLRERIENGWAHRDVILPIKVDDENGYHMECYRRFTALPKKSLNKIKEAITTKHQSSVKNQDEDIINDKKEKRTTRSDITSPKPLPRTGIFPSVCLFCNQKRKKVKGEEQKLVNVQMDDCEAKIREDIKKMEDTVLERRLEGITFSVKEVKYHRYCRLKYRSFSECKNKSKMVKNEAVQNKNPWHHARQLHKNSFEALTQYLDEVLIERKEVMSLNDINNYYIHLLREFDDSDLPPFSSTQKLQNNLQQHYGEKIKITSSKNRRGNIIFSASLSVEEVVANQMNLQAELDNKVRETALLLRETILKHSKKHTLPNNLTVEDIYKGEVETPGIVKLFFQNLIGGPDPRRWKKDTKQRRIEAICQDAIFGASSGKLKPSKQLMLGLSIKSLTNSRKVIEILNKLGHCVSYHTIEELETELTFESDNRNLMTPQGMKLDPSLGTGIAWDNYDLFVNTESGKDTLHDTVGIAYQVTLRNGNQDDEDQESNNSLQEREFTGKGKQKRRRTYEAKGVYIQPYRKKPKLSFYAHEDLPELSKGKVEDLFLKSWQKDMLWMSSYVNRNSLPTPLWAGWNSLLSKPQDHIHKIWYVRQINESPTSRSVVAETMKRSITMAEEAGRETIAVTYDLAIAKLSLQIQHEEKPSYDKIFISLGSFHVEMAFLSALGKIIAESGGPHILNESNVIAKGSIKSFLTAKNYKRAKRNHEILSVATRCLHFDEFMKSENMHEEGWAYMLEDIERNKNNVGEFNLSKEVEEILGNYKEYCKKTEQGLHGKTAQYWIQYSNAVQLYHDFLRSIREGNLELHIQCFPKMSSYFFALNHVNYARWCVKYYYNLLNLPNTHPEVYEDFKRGWFALKRTEKSFSSIPIDLTLEQTVNADASSQRTGISSITKSISARQRWVESHFMRISVITKLLDTLNMSHVEEGSRYLRQSQISKDNTAVQKVISSIKETMNPFSDIDGNHLFNLATGKAAVPQTESFLLNIVSTGEQAQEKFVSECIEKPSRFEERIQKQKINNFASEGCKKNVKSKDGKIIAACLVRDIFGKLLCIALDKKIDIKEVLRYPLTHVPLSLAHVDGTPLKTQKSAAMKYLESKTVSISPTHVDVTIVDASFFIHLFSNLPSTFGGVAEYLLRRILELGGSEIHFIADKWQSPSIKDTERNLRGSSNDVYSVKGSSQQRPGNWIAALRSNTFKHSFIEFLIHAWEDSNYIPIFEGKVLYANSGDKCFKYCVTDGVLQREEVPFLYSTHEEADSRMFFHLSNIQRNKNVIIRTADSDCLIIGLGCMENIDPLVKVWLDVGLQSNNTQRYININQLFEELGSKFCKSLMSYHALTGCDYTAAFSRRGKVKPIKILEKNESIQEALYAIIEEEEIDPIASRIIENYICEVYGSKELETLDEVRLKYFLKSYRPKTQEERISMAKKFDACSMPPCSFTLKKKLRRTQYIAKIWSSSTSPFPPNIDPLRHGWKLSKEGSYEIEWFDCDVTPTSLDITCNEDAVETDEGEIIGHKLLDYKDYIENRNVVKTKDAVNAEQFIHLVVSNVEIFHKQRLRFGGVRSINVSYDLPFKDLQSILVSRMPPRERTIVSKTVRHHPYSMRWRLINKDERPGDEVDYMITSCEYPLHDHTTYRNIFEHENFRCLYVLVEWEAIEPAWRFRKIEVPKPLEESSCEEARMTKKEKQIVTLNDCLQLQTQEEELPSDVSWRCEFCRKKQEGLTKKLSLWSLPDVLVFHLKRFDQFHGNDGKITTVVEYPIEGLNMFQYLAGSGNSRLKKTIKKASIRLNYQPPPENEEDCIYDLKGVCNHLGRFVNTGHYTAYCKNSFDNQWYTFDDRYVTKIERNNDVISSNAYLLFYQRRNVSDVVKSKLNDVLTSVSPDRHWSSLTDAQEEEKVTDDVAESKARTDFELDL